MNSTERSGGKRLDGWKVIAAYFKRDRTTVMRWARDRELPVRRIPGGKQGTVFAFQHELAAWALQHDDLSAAELPSIGAKAATELVAAPRAKDRRIRALWPRALWMGVSALALILASVVGWHLAHPPRYADAPKRNIAMPTEPAVARDYVAARDHWARRTPSDLSAAIRLFEGVIRRDPAFAPAHAGLAEAWLLIREYGEIDEPAAYRAARRHAEEALRLDPKLPDAYRALGFIDYWWSSRTASALARFQRAILLDERDALTHFWYANVLADLGRDEDAQQEYDKARLLAPGSRVIEVEQACSDWQAGRDEEALRKLTALSRRAPDDATIYNCLAWVHISRGDIAGYAQALTKRARLRREPQLLRLSDALNKAVQHDPGTAVHVLIADGRREIAAGARQLRETPAFYASAMGDRPSLVQLMTEANDLREEWPSAPLTRRIAQRWQGDKEVERLLAGLTPAAANPSER